VSTLAVRMANSENAQKFKEQFLAAMESNKGVIGTDGAAAEEKPPAAAQEEEKKPAAADDKDAAADAEKKAVDVS